MLKIKAWKQKLTVTAVVCVCVAVLYVFDVPCAIKALTGFNCPGCGMTRAVLAALRLDFAAAFAYNRMFWSLPLLYWCFLKDGKIFESRILNIVLYTAMTILFMANVAFC